MDPDYVLKWMVGISSLFALAGRLHRPHPYGRGWHAILAALLALLIIGALLEVPGTGYALASLWLVLVGVPMWASARQLKNLKRDDLPRAVFWARLVAALHPLDGTAAQARLLEARALARRGQFDTAASLLQPLLRDWRQGELCRLELMRLRGEWAAIVRHVEGQPEGTRDFRLAPAYLEALGETEDVSGLLTVFQKLPAGLRRAPNLQLMVLAYAGRDRLVDLLLARPEPFIDPLRALYLRAVAKQAAGDVSEARVLLEQLRDQAPWHRQALKRSRHPLGTVAGNLEAGAERALGSLEQLVLWDQAHPPRPPRRPLVTWALMTTLVVTFIASAQGGSTDAENLISWGALQLPLLDPADRWRILTAGLLHLGATHLVLNVLALWLLGRAVEQMWGRASVLWAFVVGSAGAYWLASLTMHVEANETRVLLGASAGVFGLVGALMTFDCIGALLGHLRLFNRRVVALSLLIIAQLVFDWFTPIVSSLLHFAGAGFGALSALPLAVWHWRTHEGAT